MDFYYSFFWCGSFLKSLLNLLRIISVLCFRFFDDKTCGHLSGDQTHISYIGRESPNQWTTREVPQWALVNTVVVPSGLTIVLLSTWLQSTEKNRTYFDLHSKKQAEWSSLLRRGSEAAWAHIPAHPSQLWDLTLITYSLLASLILHLEDGVNGSFHFIVCF